MFPEIDDLLRDAARAAAAGDVEGVLDCFDFPAAAYFHGSVVVLPDRDTVRASAAIYLARLAGLGVADVEIGLARSEAESARGMTILAHSHCLDAGHREQFDTLSRLYLQAGPDGRARIAMVEVVSSTNPALFLAFGVRQPLSLVGLAARPGAPPTAVPGAGQALCSTTEPTE